MSEDKEDAKDKTSHLWKKGQSGNLKGRPKGKTLLKSELQALLNSSLETAEYLMRYSSSDSVKLQSAKFIEEYVSNELKPEKKPTEVPKTPLQQNKPVVSVVALNKGK